MKFVAFIFLILPVIIFAQDFEPIQPLDAPIFIDEPIVPIGRPGRPIRPPIRPPPFPIEEDDTRVIPTEQFTVVAPYGIRQGKPYNIYVRGFSIRRTIRLNIRINGTTEAGQPLNIQRTATISRESSSASLQIDTSSITKGSYTLFVVGGGVTEKRTLTYVGKKYTFLIFLNKAIFLPGDLLQYKVFVIDSETNAVCPRCSTTIAISDPSRNSIASIQNATFVDGRYGSDFQLSSKASLGNWQIQVTCGDEVVTKEFQVDEYVLPLLELTLTIDEQIPASAGKFPIKIDAVYTFGGDVSGTAFVIISNYNENVFKKSVEISSGSVTFDVDIAQDLLIPPGRQYAYFDISVSFNDPLTGTNTSVIKNFRIVPYAYSIYTKPESIFKPGSPYRFTAFLKKYDGSPAPVGTQIEITALQPTTIPPQTVTIDERGQVTTSVDVPAGTEVLNLRLTARDASEGSIYESIRWRPTPGPSLNLEVLTLNPSLDERVEIKITSGESVPFVVLHIVAKGVLLRSTRVWFDENSEEPNTVIYGFTITERHIPGTQVIAYYIDKKGNFIIGNAFVQLEDDFTNYLKVTPKETEVKPGAKVDFQIESKQYSTVSLVAVDQRNLLLKTGGNITKANVVGDLQRYNQYQVNYDWENVATYEYSFGGNGLYIFTNIPRPIRRYWPRPMRPEAMERPAAPGRPDAVRGPESTNKNNVQIRKDFRETFLWRDVEIQNSVYGSSEENYDYKGLETICEKVPESITKYLIYGVSMNQYFGLGLPDEISSVTIFLPFFLSVELPYSVKRNEVLIEDIIIFNYLRRSQTVEVKVTKNSRYTAVDLTRYGWRDTNGFYVQTVTTRVGQNVKLQFGIRPTVIGFVEIEVTAKGPVAGDGIKKQLRVIPEGIPRSITSSTFIAIDSSVSSQFSTNLSCTLPPSAYLDTTEVSSTVVGDIFGKALNNLENLIQLPGGCGEQTMLSFAPNIAIYLYLKAANKLTPALQGKLVSFTASGYQNQLRYQRTDGSFSAFGNSDRFGSTWLSAYVIKYFYLARDITTIDSNVIKRAADFVIARQSADGRFIENGTVIHKDMQGGSGNGLAMTAYITIVLTTILPGYPQYTTPRNRAITLLENGFSASSTTYELGVIAYALRLAGSSRANAAFNLFNARRTEESLTLYWNVPAPPNPDFWYNAQARSLDIEVTSYGLLVYIRRASNLNSLIKIVKYLVSKANDLGGYSSSQDTVMAFEALSEFSRTFTSGGSVNLKLTPNVGSVITATVDSTNAFTLQSFNLNSNARRLGILATSTGSGLAIVSLVCNFYEDPNRVVPSFNVTYKFGDSCFSRIAFDACAAYLPSGRSNMAIMIVTMPSGFIYNEWSSSRNPDVTRTEVTNQGSKVTFYFNSIGNRFTCVNINTYRANVVAELKGGTIQVFDYYDTSKQGSTSYPIPMLPACYRGPRFVR